MIEAAGGSRRERTERGRRIAIGGGKWKGVSGCIILTSKVLYIAAYNLELIFRR